MTMDRSPALVVGATGGIGVALFDGVWKFFMSLPMRCAAGVSAQS